MKPVLEILVKHDGVVSKHVTELPFVTSLIELGSSTDHEPASLAACIVDCHVVDAMSYELAHRHVMDKHGLVCYSSYAELLHGLKARRVSKS